MMNLTNAYGNQGMSTLPSQNTVNLQRSPAIMNGSPLPPGAVNQFAQMPSMGKNHKLKFIYLVCFSNFAQSAQIQTHEYTTYQSW
jgi:hypothetical protein